LDVSASSAARRSAPVHTRLGAKPLDHLIGDGEHARRYLETNDAAVLRSITISNLVASSINVSAGDVPLKTFAA